jgi:hypothetical protein
MTKFIAYVPDEVIEKDAQALLADFANARGVLIEPPIPIDDIIEKYLKIGIEFDDTHRLFQVPRSGDDADPDILGAIFFDEKRIVIDESLDPDASPAKEGRYRYTAAHEVGHWRLHRGLSEFSAMSAAQALKAAPRRTNSLALTRLSLRRSTVIAARASKRSRWSTSTSMLGDKRSWAWLDAVIRAPTGVCSQQSSCRRTPLLSFFTA